MRRFKLISRDDAYEPLICGKIYSGDVKPHGWGKDVLWNAKFHSEDWEEILEYPENLLHQTDLGYYAGLFASQGCNIDQAIIRSNELIKKLKEECQNQ